MDVRLKLRSLGSFFYALICLIYRESIVNNLIHKQMKIEINVSRLEKRAYYTDEKVYKHLFATAERSITRLDELERVLPEIRSKFPSPEYKITVSVDPAIHYGFELDESDTTKDIVDGVHKAVYPTDFPKKGKKVTFTKE